MCYISGSMPSVLQRLYVCSARIYQKPHILETSLNYLYVLSVAVAWSCPDNSVINYVLPPFPQIDIIGAMVIVWRARGKIIRCVLCGTSIVCNSCTQ